MARIDTNNYYPVEEVAVMFGRTVSTIKGWIKYGDFNQEDVLVYQGNTYILKKAVDTFKSRLID